MANKSIARIEGILQFYSVALGPDYNAYRNHVYRVYHLALIFGKNQLSTEEEEILRIACAFHDLGAWTHNSMNYISSSENLCQSYLEENHMEDLAPKIFTIIRFHHMLSEYKSDYALLTEAFRKADMTDLSIGYFRNDLPKTFYHNLKEEFPFLGFHKLIFKKVISYALRHPLAPFPMVNKSY